ncbi:ABC transporter G family member 23-like [Diadema setosum]|uniref:ABC transporter G family member 23-like n=1 Tax=Diadema setosum TaxID=31175 RepID=UPI003B3A1205
MGLNLAEKYSIGLVNLSMRRLNLANHAEETTRLVQRAGRRIQRCVVERNKGTLGRSEPASQPANQRSCPHASVLTGKLNCLDMGDGSPSTGAVTDRKKAKHCVKTSHLNMSMDIEAHGDVGRHALECYELSKHYGRGKSRVQVLQKLGMKVPKGKIYGLLGPSGCGKTTLLRCVLGMLSYDEGLILTFGRPPLTRGHGIPGNRVGYMPQEVALYNEFTIKEMLVYFATIHKMSRKETKVRLDFLVDLLNLPEKSRIVAHLSGGQKRRVSFAAALIQSPEFLILDEPTVGVDPLLRERIWDYLLKFASEGRTTIIITTHYIEEARSADMVGLMRNGKILSEDSPKVLLERHNLPTLESVFLQLCMADVRPDDAQACTSDDSVTIANESAPTERTKLLSSTTQQESTKSYTNPTFDEQHCQPTKRLRARSNLVSHVPDYHYDKPRLKCTDLLPSIMSMWALFIKDWIKLVRNPGLAAFYFLVPILEISLFFLAIGAPPKNLAVGVVNLEDPPQYSKCFLDQLDNETIIQKHVNTVEEAYKNIGEGAYWGIIEIPSNYSHYLQQRLFFGLVDNTTLQGSTIKVGLDATNQQIALSLQQAILEAYEKFVSSLLLDNGINPAVAEVPVDFTAVYGDIERTFTDFMAAGVIISVIFFLAVGLTSVTFVVERKEGLMDRTWVAGVGTGEVTIAHVSMQFLVIAVQITVVLLFTMFIFKIPNEGNVFLIVLMCILQGLCGMSFGLLISSICDTEAGAVQAALGSFYPIMLLSGIIWPVQAIPYPLYWISIALPQTYAAEGLRAIMSKGWGVDHFVVWIGYVITTAWWVIPLILSAIILKVRR